MQHKLIVALFLIFIAVFTQISLAGSKETENGPMAVPVEAITLKLQPWEQSIKATGTLSAEQGVMVRPEISGRIKQILFQSGTSVEKGALLVELDPSVLKAQLELYKANLTLSQITYNRSVDLYKTHSIAKADMDKAVATLQADKAQVDQAQAQLNQTTLEAPFSGRLGLRLVSVGDYLQAGQDIVTLQQIDPLNADFTVAEADMSKVQVGQRVTLKVDAYPNETFEGKVSALNAIINSSNRSLAVRALIDNKEGKLIPGGFAEVTLFVGKQEKVINLPITALVFSDQGSYVYKIVNGKAVKVIVTLGQRTRDTVQVIKGLSANDVVVTAGQQKLQEGTAVMVLPKK